MSPLRRWIDRPRDDGDAGKARRQAAEVLSHLDQVTGHLEAAVDRLKRECMDRDHGAEGDDGR